MAVGGGLMHAEPLSGRSRARDAHTCDKNLEIRAYVCMCVCGLGMLQATSLQQRARRYLSSD